MSVFEKLRHIFHPSGNGIQYLSEKELPFPVPGFTMQKGAMSEISFSSSPEGESIFLKRSIEFVPQDILNLFGITHSSKEWIFIEHPFDTLSQLLDTDELLMRLREIFEDHQTDFPPDTHRLIAEAILYDHIWSMANKEGFSPAIPRFYGLFLRKVEDLAGNVQYEVIVSLENIQGDKLDTSLKDTDALLKALLPVARTLDWLHEKGIFHRDLKPSNILIKVTGYFEALKAVLVDFGTSLLGQETLVGRNIWGTLPFTDIALLSQKLGYANSSSDLYSLAVIVAMILTKQTNPWTLSGMSWSNGLEAKQVNKMLGQLIHEQGRVSLLDPNILGNIGLKQSVINLLRDATRFDPNRRLNITLVEFINEIINVIKPS